VEFGALSAPNEVEGPAVAFRKLRNEFRIHHTRFSHVLDTTSRMLSAQGSAPNVESTLPVAAGLLFQERIHRRASIGVDLMSNKTMMHY
jgi:hypothetical protein